MTKIDDPLQSSVRKLFLRTFGVGIISTRANTPAYRSAAFVVEHDVELSSVRQPSTSSTAPVQARNLTTLACKGDKTTTEIKVIE